MKVLILTYGSRGDVQPYVALGKGLKQAGHDVTLATSVRFRDFVDNHGLHFGALSDEMLALVDTDLGRDIMENTTSVLGTLKRIYSLKKQLGPAQRALLDDCWEVARAADPDIILFHPKAFGGPHFAEKLGIPAILALPVPIIVPTATRPNMGFPDLRIGGWYNRATYRFVNLLIRMTTGSYVKAWRELNALPPRSNPDFLHMADGSRIPVLHAVSEHVLPRPADWPSQAIMSGYWFLDEEKEYEPPPHLEEFLESGPPPLYAGFGSMSGRNPARLTAAIVDAMRATGNRAVIATGWGGLRPGDLPRSILCIDEVPHNWLFPRVAAVIHHGGAGTTAAALRAGKPSVVVPFFADQPFWGKIVHDLGAAAAPIPQKRLTGQNLAEAIREVTTDQRLIGTAGELGKRIRAEDGIARAVAFIEAVARDDR